CVGPAVKRPRELPRLPDQAIGMEGAPERRRGGDTGLPLLVVGVARSDGDRTVERGRDLIGVLAALLHDVDLATSHPATGIRRAVADHPECRAEALSDRQLHAGLDPSVAE